MHPGEQAVGMSGSPATSPGILERNVLQMANTDVPVVSQFLETKVAPPEIHDIKEPPDCFARGDTKVAKVIICTSCNLMVRIKSIIAFHNEKKQRANWGVHRK